MTFRIDGNSFNFPEDGPKNKPKKNPEAKKFDIGGALGKQSQIKRISPEDLKKIEEAVDKFKSRGNDKPEHNDIINKGIDLKLTPEEREKLKAMLDELKNSKPQETYPIPTDINLKLTPEQREKLMERFEEIKNPKPQETNPKPTDISLKLTPEEREKLMERLDEIKNPKPQDSQNDSQLEKLINSYKTYTKDDE